MAESKYIDNATLKALIEGYRTTGVYPKALDDAVTSIVKGYVAGKRIRQNYGDVIAEDIISDAHADASLAIVNGLLDTNGNPFNYITRIAASRVHGHCNLAIEQNKNLQKYCEDTCK